MLHVLTRVNATLSTYSFDLSGTPVLKEARAGDVIALEIVSAPWPAWKCVCTKADMTIESGARMEARTIRRRNDKKLTIVGNGSWRAGNYMEIEVSSTPLQSLNVSFVASDQGFGGTDTALVRLSLIDGSTNNIKVQHVLKRVNHDRVKYEIPTLTSSNCEVMKQAVKSDRIVLEAVSPPWQAWSCSLFSASMKLNFLGPASST